MPRLIGSAGAALLGTATVLTAVGGRTISGQGDHHVVQPGQPALPLADDPRREWPSRSRGTSISTGLPAFVLLALYLQNVHHYSPIRSGFAVMPVAIVGLVVGRMVLPQAMKRFGAESCVVLFLPAHPRRRWCSRTRCGNRARVSRYYQRHKAGRSGSAGAASGGQRH